ncbi:MAG: hypothetical protein ACRD97_11570 [Nitrososphaeraceae archaeon]
MHRTPYCYISEYESQFIVNKMAEIQSSNAPLSVILSMLGGIFIVFGGLMLFAMLSWYGSTLMMGGQWHMYMFTYPRWLTAVVATISVLAGGLVMSASYKMYKEPRNKLWGLLIVIGSLVSLLSIGGFGLGGVLGLIGGVMGLSRRIQQT